MAIQLTTQASDYVKRIKEYTEEGKKKSQWEEYFLSPLQQQTSQNIAGIQAQTAYDISGAFANYQKQQRQLMAQTKLGSGFKEEVGEELRSAYQSAYTQAQAESLSGIAQEAQAYSTALEKEEERLTKVGQQYADIENASLDLLKRTYGLTDQEIWSTDPSGTQTMTEYARSKLVDLAYGEDFAPGTETPKYETYANYLQNLGLYDTYLQNRSDINKYLFGVAPETWSVGKQESTYTKEYEERKKYANILGDSVDLNKPVEDYVKEIFKSGKNINKRTRDLQYLYMDDVAQEALKHEAEEIFNYKGTWYKRSKLRTTDEFARGDPEKRLKKGEKFKNGYIDIYTLKGV